MPEGKKDKKPFLVELEEKILHFWNERKIFERVLARTKRSKPFIFYEGPPTANGLPHIGHAETRAFKDIILRYKTMRGFWVMRKAGWDTHGLPVEIEVEKRLGLKSKADIERYGIAKFNQACRESVWKYKEEWEHFSRRIGFWIDFKDPYITYDNDYIESLWWVIQQFWKKGYLYEDYKVVPWCPRCGTPLASHELAQDDGYRSITEDSIYVRFRVKAKSKEWKNTSILSWTTTPWTLPGNVALAVQPQEEYVCVPDPDYIGHWVVLGSKSFLQLLEKGIFPSKYRDLKKPKIDFFKGREMIGIEYEPLYPVKKLASHHSYKVYPADFVTMEDGTGVVHTAVMYGEEDFHLGKKFHLPQHHTVDLAGRFTSDVPQFEGAFVKDADPDIIRDLEKRGLLLKTQKITHDYPFCWRCHTPVLYYARQAWWVKRKSLRKELLKANSKINWIPSHLHEGRFGEWLRDIKDWAFSRERFWGTPLPVWKCTHCKRIEVVGSLEEIKRRSFPIKNRYLVLRHGESESNMLGVSSSWPEKVNFHLTDKGKEQVKKDAAKLKKEHIDLVFSSDLLRTKETASIIQKVLEKDVEFVKDLREMNFGVYTGKPESEDHKLFSSLKERFTKPFTGGESWNDVRARMVNFVRSLEEKYVGENILLISHGDPLWLLAAALQGLNDEETLSYAYPETGSFHQLSFVKLPLNEKGTLDFHRPYIDEVHLRCHECKKEMTRVKEVIDVWFDSGAMPFAQFHYPFAFKEKSKPEVNGRKLTELPYPADFITEAIDQTRGWFNSLLNVSVLLGKGASYKNVISFGHVLDADGKKMSKHLGNIVEPIAMMQVYGADALRWYFFTVNQPEDPKRFKESDLGAIQRGFLMILWNIVQFLLLYGPKQKLSEEKRKLHVLDEWIFSRLHSLIADVTRSLDAYVIVEPARAIQKFVVDDFSQWWLRRSRRRFQQPENEHELLEATKTLVEVLSTVAKLMAPFTPFLSEAIWRELRPWLSGGESVHMAHWPDVRALRKETEIEKEMAWVREVVSKALALRQEAKIKVRQPLSILRLKAEKARGQERFLPLIADEVNVKRVEMDPRFKVPVFLDTTVTSALKEEGMVRELIRVIQEMRREAGMKPKEKASIVLEGKAGALMTRNRQEHIMSATHVQFVASHNRGFSIQRELVLEGDNVIIRLKKA